MQESIQQLTDKIYREGVEKAEKRSKEILEEAARKARELVDEAENRARQIIESAEKNAAAIKMKNEAEMRLSARQAVGLLKNRITDLVVWHLTHEPVINATNDIEFMQALIRKLMDYWLAHFGQEERLRILLPKDDYQQYRKYLEDKTGELLRTGISIEFSGVMKNGFQVEAVDLGFKVSFTDEDFENYFANFARPRIYKLLFGKED